MVTIVCVWKTGGDFDAEYVRRLCGGVRRHLRAARFACLTDATEPMPASVDVIPLVNGWPGWWSKMEVFRSGLFDGLTLYFDLDTAIIGDLSNLVAAIPESGFVMLRDFYDPKGVGSGVMGWSGDWSSLYTAFAADAGRNISRYNCRHRWGDQAFIRDHLPCTPTRWQDIAPGEIASYKVDCRNGVPDGARVVAFHGRPRPREVGWLAA